MRLYSLGRVLRAFRSRLGWLNGTVLALLLVGVIITPFLPGDAAGAFATIATLAGTSTAGTTILRKRRRVPAEERPAWSLVGVGLLLITLGLVVFAVSLALSPATVFGPHDLCFLAGYGTGMLGIALLPHTKGSRLQRIRLLLDSVIGAVAILTLGWVFLYAEVAAALETAPTWDRLVGSAYPLMDTTMLVVVTVVVIRRSTYRFDPRLLHLALGSVVLAAADVAFLIKGAGKSFVDAEPVFPLTLAAIAFFVVVGVSVDRPIEVREYADRPSTPLWAMILPYGTAAVMLAVLVIRLQRSPAGSEDGILNFAALLILVMVFARQSVAIRENRRFVEDQRTVLVASISHELRTPLTAMVGFLDLLESDGSVDDEERREMVSIVNEQASYMSRTVADLVMLASEHTTTMDLTIEPCSIDAITWGSVNSIAIDPASVRVDADANMTAYVDRGRIIHALANLLANAARYGGDKVAIVATADGGDLVIEVHDNGPGVPRKYELLVWEKFERGPNRLNAAVPGSGIGLAVTNAIVKAHGGNAGYRRSGRLGGACFWLRLPGRVQIEASTPTTLLRGVPRDADAQSA
jgi:signal transduction histidine kinase